MKLLSLFLITSPKSSDDTLIMDIKDLGKGLAQIDHEKITIQKSTNDPSPPKFHSFSLEYLPSEQESHLSFRVDHPVARDY